VTISELAAAVGMTPGAIRWYERVGALRPPVRRANGYRHYDPRDVALLRLIVALRRVGLTPVEAGAAATALTSGEVTPDLRAALGARLDAIARERASLDQLEAEIRDLGETMDALVHSDRSTDDMSDHRPIRVLFLCTGNSARSQIAEALLGELGGADFEVASAGTEPRAVNPYAIRVLAESGIDWSGARSKLVTEFVDQPWDYVITVCDRARQACPVFPGRGNDLHWGLDDPAEVEGTDDERLAAFRHTRVELAMRLRPFVTLARRAAGVERADVGIG
jgi:arsenate reductase